MEKFLDRIICSNLTVQLRVSTRDPSDDVD